MNTAKHLADKILGKDQYPTNTPYAMVKFAKLHVKAALEAVVDRGQNCFGDLVYDSKESILSAYPETKII